MSKSRVIPDTNFYASLYKEVDFRSDFQHNNFIKMQGYYFNSTKNFCGNTNKYNLYYEYFEHNLDKEVNKRHKYAVA